MFVHFYTRTGYFQQDRYADMDEAMWNAFCCSTQDGVSLGDIVDETNGHLFTYDEMKSYWNERQWRAALLTTEDTNQPD